MKLFSSVGKYDEVTSRICKCSTQQVMIQEVRYLS